MVSAIAVAAATGCATHPPPRPHREVEVDFAVNRLVGGVYKLSEDRGHVVMVDVFATWCEPCQESLPIVDALAHEYRARGVRMYALNVDARENLKDVGPFIQKLNIRLPVLLDPDGDVAEKVLHVQRMPTSFVIDADGVIRFRNEGFTPELLRTAETQVESLIAEGGPPL